MKSKFLQIAVLIILIIHIFSCSPSRRFDYNTAYKFKYIKHHPEIDTLPPEQLFVRLSEDTNQNPAESITGNNHFPVNEDLPEESVSPVKTEVAGSEDDNIKQSYQTLSRQDKKEFKRNTIRKLKEVKKEYRKIKKRNRGSLFGDIPPRLQGFIWVAIGLGVVLVGTILIPAETISVIVIILGFGLVIFGFLKILGIIK